MNQITVQINRIMAHNSPVLIVQRFIRGYLARKQTGKYGYFRFYIFLVLANKLVLCAYCNLKIYYVDF